MIESYKSMGLKQPSVIEGENFVKCLGLPRATAGRRLKEMEKKNKVQKRGRGPATRYFKAGMIPD